MNLDMNKDMNKDGMKSKLGKKRYILNAIIIIIIGVSGIAIGQQVSDGVSQSEFDALTVEHQEIEGNLGTQNSELKRIEAEIVAGQKVIEEMEAKIKSEE